MDVEQLHVVLQHTFSPDASIRNPAEETLKNLKHIKGSTVLLLQVAAEKQVQYEVRQAAAIQLKNICREIWIERNSNLPSSLYAANTAASSDNANGENKPLVLCDEDKELVKRNLIDALLSEPEKSVRDLLAETLHYIAIHDFPTKWNYLVPTILNVIQSAAAPGALDDANTMLRVHNALLALRKLAKRYEYKSKDQRGPLNDIVNSSFPLLMPLAQYLSGENQNTVEHALMLKLILKIFWSSTQFYLPTGTPSDASTSSNITNLNKPETMQPWFDILVVVLKKPLPEASTGQPPLNQPLSVEDRTAWPWWKLKKWSVQIMSRLFSRYGIPTYVDDEDVESKNFAVYFSTNVSVQFLQPVCETLNLRPSGQFCTDRVIHLCLTYIDLAVEIANTYKMLKPHMSFLLYQVCFPTMCLSEDDIELFNNDPHEFVHRQNSPLTDFYDPRMSAITLITDLVKHRGQDVTQPLLGFLTNIIHTYTNEQDPAKKNHIEKDGALLCFGSLSSYLLNKKKYAKELEGLIITSVFPDFNSPIAFLRCRACWMIQRFSTISWSDDGTNLRTLIQLVLQRLSDPALPVQIEASKALKFLIEVDGAEVTLLPVLPQILTEYFRIMNEIGNDEVVAALQVIIDRFGDHIEPHAVALVTQLSNAFNTYCNADQENNNDDDCLDDDAAMAAAQCLECIATVLKGIASKPELYKTLEPQLIPLVLKILGTDGDYIEYLECALDILTFLTYFPADISPELWQSVPLIYLAFDQWAYDYLNLMVPPLQSFITKGPQLLLSLTTNITGSNPSAGGTDGGANATTTVKFIDLIFNMVAKTISNDRSSESECRQALSLIMCILHNYASPGPIDGYIPLINDMVLGKLGQQVEADVPLTRISIYQVLGSSLYYNAQLQLAEFEKRSVTTQVFTKWIQDMQEHMTGDDARWIPRKLTVLGLSSILNISPMSSLPPSLYPSQIPQLISFVVQMTEAMKNDAEKENAEIAAAATAGNQQDAGAESNAGGAGHADDEEEDDGGFGEDEDVTNEVDEAYKKALSGMSDYASDDYAKFLMGGDYDWDDEFMDDDLDEGFSSPVVDHINELIYLNDTLKTAFQREPEIYQQIQSSLPQETLNSCQTLFAAADAIRLQQQQVQQQQQS